MTSEKFCLRWNDFESHVSGSFREIRDSKDFFDVTLVCGEEQVQAHKVIISACSPFFRDILRRNPHQHPLLYLKGVKFTELQSVMNFMYHGEANIAQEDLNSFLSVAEELKVKGLTQSQVGGGGEASKPFKPPSKDPPPPPPKRPKMTSSHKTADDDDIQEIMPVKTEPAAARTDFYSGDQVEADTQVAEYGEETYENYEEYDTDQGYGVAPVGQNFDAKGNYIFFCWVVVSLNCTWGKGLIGVEFDLSWESASTGQISGDFLEYVAKVTDGPDVGKFVCTLCGKVNAQKIHTQNHIESIHFPGTNTYPCKHCDMVFNGRNKLYIHVNQMHKSK